MRRTKLDSSKSAYSSRTVFVFFVQRAVKPEMLREAHDELADRQLPGLAYLVGRVDEDLFQVMQVYRRYAGPVNVKLSDMVASPELLVAEARRGMSALQRKSEKPIPTENPFMRYLS